MHSTGDTNGMLISRIRLFYLQMATNFSTILYAGKDFRCCFYCRAKNYEVVLKLAFDE